MNESKRTTLSPNYMKTFHCIGSACEDSCCIGWRVDLDKKTYQLYKDSRDEQLRPVFQNQVKRKHNQKSDASYGKINMCKDGRCPFLNEKNLCQIYLNIGEHALSETCTHYPRMVHKVDGVLEKSTTMSCPPAAKLALLNPEPMEFVRDEEPKSVQNKLHKTFDTEGHLFFNKPQRFFWDIRMFAIGLLQNREYNLGERLVLLGMYYKRVESLQEQGIIQDISTMTQNFRKMVDDGSLKNELVNVPANTQMQMRLAKEMTDARMQTGVTSERYMECLKEALVGIGYVEGTLMSDVYEKYDQAHNDYYQPYIKEKEYILENYLVNEYFKELMPFGAYHSIWDSYVFLCVLYGVVKLHLIGMAGCNKGLTDDQVIKLIQSFSKTVLHNNAFIQHLIIKLKENQLDSLAFMAILVKN